MTEQPAPTLRQLLDAATRVLAEAGVPSARHDAHALAAHVYGLPRVEPVTAPPPPEGFAATLAELVERRRRREPLQHIVGHTAFRYVTLRVEPGVFVPRPETEVVAGVAIDESVRVATTGRTPLVVDLCTGAGGIAAAVASETSARVVAVDASADAVALAAANTGSLSTAPVRVEVGDVREPALLADLRGTVDVVVANPPYIPPDAVPLDVEVRDHDPDLALYGGGLDGLMLPAAVVARAADLLHPGGLLVMEHADSQGSGARALADGPAWTDVATGQDLTGRDRYLVARRT